MVNLRIVKQTYRDSADTKARADELQRNPGPVIRATGDSHAAREQLNPVQAKSELSMSLPLLRERVDKLDHDIVETRLALNAEMKKLWAAQDESDTIFDKIRKIAGVVEGVGAVAGIVTITLFDLATGGIIPGTSVAVAFLARSRRKASKSPRITENKPKSRAVDIYETRIAKLEGDLVNLGEQKNEALGLLQQEEDGKRNEEE